MPPSTALSALQRLILLATVLVVAGVLVGPAQAGIGLSGLRIRASGDDEAAVASVLRALRAADTVTYQATQHVALRDGDSTWSTTRQVRNQPGGLDPLVPLQVLRALLDSYQLAMGPVSHTGGRPATTVTASSGGRLTARLWFDVDTGLLVRRDLFDDGGQRVSSTRLTGLTVVDRHGHGPVLADPAPANAAGVLPAGSASGLQQHGWCSPDQMAGMQRLGQGWLHPGGHSVLRLDYTDGLTSATVFEQAGRLDQSALRRFDPRSVDGHAAYVRIGAPTVVAWSDTGVVFTVVTDGPPDDLPALVDDLPHDPSSPGVLDRIGTGLSRMADWVIPG